MTGFERVPQRPVEANLVHVVASAPRAQHVTGIDEILNDAVHSAFANADEAGDLGQAYLMVLGDADHHVRVVGQKRPRWDRGGFVGELSGHLRRLPDQP